MTLGTSSRAIDARRPVVEPSGAFISYSRDESVKVAVALQAALERFAKPWYRLRSVRVFRDDTNMAANSDLRGTIETALARSGWFILLASPKAARSSWVESEIRWWLEHRSADRIMLVQTAGEILWHPVRNCFDLVRSSAVPAILEHAYGREPRWIDLRWFSEAEGLGAADPRFGERVADLAAPIHGKERADIVGENVRQHRRTVRLARGAASALVILLALSLIATVVAFQQRRDANRQRDAAVQQNLVSVARQLAATAVNLTNTDMQRASLVAVQAYRLHADAQTAAALYSTAAASPQLVGFLDAGAAVTATSGTPDGNFVVAGTSTGDVWRWNRETGVRERLLQLGREVRRVLMSDDGNVVAAWATTDAAQAARGLGAVWRRGTTTPGDNEIMALSRSGGLVVEAVPTNEDGTVILRVRRGTTVVLEKSVAFTPMYGWVQLPTEDRMVVVESGGRLSAYELPSGRQVIKGMANTGAHAGVSAVDPTGAFVTVTNGGKEIEIDDVKNVPSGEDPDPAGWGRTETPSPIAIALSPGAKRVATAVNGRIWIGSIAKGLRATPPPPIVLPGSGTTQDGTLRFLSQDLLISGSGTAVGVWDLSQYSRLGPRIHIHHEPTCNACGPGEVLVNPSGTRALIFNSGHDGVALASFSTGASSYADYSGGQLTHLVRNHAVWLDDERLFTWDDENALAAVWTGPLLDRAVAQWSVADQKRPEGVDGPQQIVLTVTGGQVVLVDSHGRLLRFDVEHQSPPTVMRRLPFVDPIAIGLNAAGDRAWALTPDGDQDPRHSHLQVVDTASAKSLVDRSLDGNFTNADLVGNLLWLWHFDSPLTTLNLSSGEISTMPFRLRDGSAVASTQPFVTYEEDGTVSLLDTRLRTTIGSFPIQTEAYAWTEFGFSEGDRVMAVATEAGDETGLASVSAVRFGYQQWQRIDCATAGRDLTADEWHQLTDLAVPSGLRCEG